MRDYFWRWLKTAFTHSLGPIDLWTGMAVAALGILDHYWPQAQIMTAYGWQIPIWVLAAVMLVRLLCAPYWMAQEDAAKLAKAEADRQTRDGKKALRDRLAQFLDAGTKLMTRCRNPQEPKVPLIQAIADWQKEVAEFIASNLDHGFLARFRDDSSQSGVTITGPHGTQWSRLNVQVPRLGDFIRELQ
jgi:uncharacterized membrane protein